MPLKPGQLEAALAKRLLPVYLLHGEEELLVQESADRVRAAARAQGCSERYLMRADEGGFSWQHLLQQANSLSLFAERRLLELRLPDGKPGAEGSKVLCQYLEQPPQEDVLLIISGKLDRTAVNSKWFKAIERAGASVQHSAVKAEAMPAWLEQRARAVGLSMDRDALMLLAARVEGNLLAAAQEIEKLRLLSTQDHISADTITSGVLDNARYTLFGLIDTALAGQTAEALRMLHGLRGEGTEAAVILWALGRELTALEPMCADCAAGQRPAQVMQRHRVWSSRLSCTGAALGRHTPDSIHALYRLTLRADAAAKGYGPGDPWLLLEQALLALATDGSGWFAERSA